jgi:ATP/maltotriose-dependent transcriptional regulator MalT
MSLGIYQAVHDRRHAAGELNNMADRCREMGELERALGYAQTAVEWAHEVPAPDIEAHAHSTLADIYLKLGDPDAAEREARLAEQLAPEALDRPRIGAWMVLARLAEQRGDDTGTDLYYGRAIDALRRTGHQSALADAALAHSLVLRKRGDTEAALKRALESVKARAKRPH